MSNMTCRISNTIYFIVVLFMSIPFFIRGTCIAEENNDLLSDINQLATLGEKAPTALIESIQTRIEKDSSAVSSLLLPKISDSSIDENRLAIYIWAIGLAQDVNAVGKIISVAETTESNLVKDNCLRALASIGGKQSGDFLMAVLNKTKGQESRFDILNLLAQIQYEPALTKTEEVLKQEFEQYYWQSIFIFGKMGDKSVPFLLRRIDHKEKNIRINAIHILGQWLIAPEAAAAFRKQYWKEKEIEIRGMILSSLEKITSDPNEIEKFSAEVAAKEKDDSLVKFAKEMLSNMPKMREMIRTFKKDKNVSSLPFQEEYEKLYRSAGKKGDYEILSKTSSFDDEAKLKKLREQILQRDSDESFYDYQKVNEMIIFNRFLKNE